MHSRRNRRLLTLAMQEPRLSFPVKIWNELGGVAESQQPDPFQTSCWLALLKTAYFPAGEDTLVRKGE